MMGFFFLEVEGDGHKAWNFRGLTVDWVNDRSP